MSELDNDTKISFCNAFDAMQVHRCVCLDCQLYLDSGDGDLCSKGKEIILDNIAYANTTPVARLDGEG